MVRYWKRFRVFPCNNRVAGRTERLSFGPRGSLASIGERPKRRFPVQLLLALFSGNQMPSEDPSLFLVGEFLERVFVSTRGGSCPTSRTSRSLHTNSTDDGSSSRTGTIRTGSMGTDVDARRVNRDVPRWDVGHGWGTELGS